MKDDEYSLPFSMFKKVNCSWDICDYYSKYIDFNYFYDREVQEWVTFYHKYNKSYPDKEKLYNKYQKYYRRK